MNAWTQNKQKLDRVYREIFGDSSDAISQSVHAEASISWHLKVLRVPTHNRKQIMQNLESHSVGCDIHYPTPLHLQKCYQPYFRGPLAETEKMASEILSIPMHAHLTEDNISEISGFLLQ